MCVVQCFCIDLTNVSHGPDLDFCGTPLQSPHRNLCDWLMSLQTFMLVRVHYVLITTSPYVDAVTIVPYVSLEVHVSFHHRFPSEA